MKLGWVVTNINDNNVSRVLTQQEYAVAYQAAADQTESNVKVRRHPMKVRESLHRKGKGKIRTEDLQEQGTLK